MTQPVPIGLALVNDHPFVLAGLRSMLASFPDRIVVIWGIDHGLAAPQAAERFRQDSDSHH